MQTGFFGDALREFGISAIDAIVFFILFSVIIAFVPLMSSFFIRFFDAKRAKRIAIQEVEDIIRHCEANIVVIDDIDCMKGLPAKMHYEKMRMYFTGMLFDNNISRELPHQVRERIVNVRLIVRNLDETVKDIIDRFYVQGCRNFEELSQRNSFMKQKFIHSIDRLGFELSKLAGRRKKNMKPRPSEIIYIRDDN